MASFLTAAATVAGSSSIGSALVRILVAYGISRLINKATGNTNTPETVDQGIRLQVGPDTTNTIPVLYGSAYLGGKITDAQLVDANKTMWYCLTLSETPTTSTLRLSDGAAVTTTVDEVYWNNQRVYFKADGITIDYLVNQDGVVDTSPRDLVKIYLYNGSAGPTRPSDLLEYLPSLPTLHGDARTLMPGWVSDERMLGLTFALVRISYNRDKGITGLPELQFKVSNNLFRPGDAIFSFLRNEISGAGLPLDQIDTASLITLNGYADDTVNYFDEDDGVSKTLANRYQINGIVNTAESVMTNLQKLAANAGCFVNYDIATGLWGVTINRDESVALAFDDSNIISGIDLTGTNLDSMYNAVEVEFSHRELRDQKDTIRIDLPTEYRNSNEPDNVLQLKLDLINEPLQARELAYLELYQNRMDQIVTFTTDYSKINTEAGDVITVSTAVYNWVNKPFRVVRVREVESAEGGLAVEITAQEYDATMYTAGGVPRRPRVPSEPIDIPDIAVIGTPAAPTVVQINNVAVPALDITGLTPAGIVDRFEYWYSSDAGVTYRVLGSRSNSNGSPYAQSTSLTFRAVSLPAGTYLFKVRGGNEKAFGDFSPASTSVAWAPVQTTDQVTASTKVGGGLSDLIGPLAMGAIAYFAYQALYPEIMKALGDSALGEIFGIPSSKIQEMKNAAGNFKLIQVGDSIQTPYNNDTITFIAGEGIEITAEANAGTITISATGGGTGAVSKIIAGEGITVTPAAGTGEVTISLSGGGPISGGGIVDGTKSLSGSIFPNYFKSSNTTRKAAIFTHANLICASYQFTPEITQIVNPESYLSPSKVGLGDTTVNKRYYSTCQYNPALSLCEQVWADWKLWKDSTTAVVDVPTGAGSTNPLPLPVYSVDQQYACGGTSLVTNVPSAYRNYFLADVPITKKETVTTHFQTLQAKPGTLVIFGVSNANLPDNTPWSNNTVFGIQTADPILSTGTETTVNGSAVFNTITFNTNKSIAVACGAQSNGSATLKNDTIWYHTSGYNSNDPLYLTGWRMVKDVTLSTSGAAPVPALDGITTGPFSLFTYGLVNGSNKFIGFRNLTPDRNEIAISSDGVTWTETAGNIPARKYIQAWSSDGSANMVAKDVTQIVQLTDGTWASNTLAFATDPTTTWTTPSWAFNTNGFSPDNPYTIFNQPATLARKILPVRGGGFIAFYAGWDNNNGVYKQPEARYHSSKDSSGSVLGNFTVGAVGGANSEYVFLTSATGAKIYTVSSNGNISATATSTSAFGYIGEGSNTYFPFYPGGIENNTIIWNTTSNKFVVYNGAPGASPQLYEINPVGFVVRNLTSQSQSILYYSDIRRIAGPNNRLLLAVPAYLNGPITYYIVTESNLVYETHNGTFDPKVHKISTHTAASLLNTTGILPTSPIGLKTNYCFPGNTGNNKEVDRTGDYGVGYGAPNGYCPVYTINITLNQT